jgi:hypothetical protein
MLACVHHIHIKERNACYVALHLRYVHERPDIVSYVALSFFTKVHPKFTVTQNPLGRSHSKTAKRVLVLFSLVSILLSNWDIILENRVKRECVFGAFFTRVNGPLFGLLPTEILWIRRKRKV